MRPWSKCNANTHNSIDHLTRVRLTKNWARNLLSLLIWSWSETHLNVWIWTKDTYVFVKLLALLRFIYTHDDTHTHIQLWKYDLNLNFLSSFFFIIDFLFISSQGKAFASILSIF